MPINRRHEELSCDLGNDEIRERGQEAARKQEARDHEERNRVSEQKLRKGNIDAYDAQIRHLLSEVRSKSTRRTVEVVDRANYETNIMETARLDTGELIRRRPLTVDEQQPNLGLAEKKARSKE